MMLQAPQVLTAEEVAEVRRRILAEHWVDGAATAGHQSTLAKHNRQLPEDCAAARWAGDLILQKLERHPLFVAAALPARVFPPLFNRYGIGETFGDHVDNAIRMTGARRIRTDLSATLFLSDPEDYEGGELTVDDTYGVHQVKLAAGDLILYPGSSLHRVEPVTKGERLASFFWIQSLIRDEGQRTLLFDMDLAIRRAAERLGHGDQAVISLTGSYHNLLRMWAET